MPAWKKLALEPRDRAQHGDAGVGGERPAYDALLPGRADAVENDARQSELRIERLAPEDEGGHGPGHLGRVHHQHDRGSDELRELRGRVGALGVRAVEQAAVALDEREVRVPRGPLQRRGDGLRRHEVRVEVATRRAGRGAEPSRIDEIRPLLEGRDPPPALRERAGEAQGHQALASVTGKTGDDDARKA
jgi:hypothetical protein